MCNDDDHDGVVDGDNDGDGDGDGDDGDGDVVVMMMMVMMMTMMTATTMAMWQQGITHPRPAARLRSVQRCMRASTSFLAADLCCLGTCFLPVPEPACIYGTQCELLITIKHRLPLEVTIIM